MVGLYLFVALKGVQRAGWLVITGAKPFCDPGVKGE
jgi:hypothetical protein